jgi:hypothetical protein
MMNSLIKRRTVPILSIVCLLSCLSASLVAQQPFIGPRAAGMGGAQTAVANDTTALWANPAGLGLDPRLDFDVFASPLATDRGGFQASVNALSVLDPNNLTPPQALAAVAALADLSRPGVGVVASGVAGLVVGERALAIGVGDVAYAGVYPMIDPIHVTPGGGPANGLAYNTSGVNSIGLEARELRIGYSYGLYGRTLLIGTALRYIRGRTYYDHVSIFDVQQDNLGSVVTNALKQNSVNTNAFTFDVGVMFNVLSTVRVGVVAAALTQPKFDVKQSTINPTVLGAPAFVQLPRTVRAGAAVTPISALTVAVDYDLLASNTLIPGGKSQQLSAGVEINLPIFAIRAGTWRDFKAIDPHWSYTAGFGLKLTVLSINAAVMLSEQGGLNLKSPARRDLGAAIDAHFKF